MTTSVTQRPERAQFPRLAKLAVVAALILGALVIGGRSPRPADAAFHIMVIDEVMAGVPGDSTVQYIELKETFGGQNMVSGKQVVVYDATGVSVGTFTFPGNVANGALLARLLIATPSAAAYYGVTPDLTMTPVMTPTGMVCWFDPGFFANIDCVPYGNYNQPNMNQSTTTKGPATINPPGNGYASLTRVGTTSKAALDFALLCATPQNNANTIGAAPVTDPDTDGVNGGGGCADNCATDSNAGQANNDRNFINLHVFGKSYDDLTTINADSAGDACDSDDDNDGLSDTDEPNLGPAGSSHALCPTATANTDPAKADTDGDRVLDGAECLLGFDPADPASKPTLAQCAAFLGVPTTLDTDGDGIKDAAEFCYYGSDRNIINTDGDFCGDGKEIASIDANTVVNATDLQQVAIAFGPSTSAGYIPDFDMDKNGNINATDLQFVATKFGACP